MSDTIDRLVRLLDDQSLQLAAARAEVKRANYAAQLATGKLREWEEDLTEAEKVLDEWEKYAAALRALIPLKKGVVLPAVPEPFLRTIPF